MYRSLLRLCAFAALSTGVAHAATGKPDLGNYVGSDSLAPAPSLPASYNTLIDVTAGNGYTQSTVTMTLPDDGDDASYGVNLGNVSLYGQALSNCNVSMNGYITCNGPFGLYDNAPLPDSRFGNLVVIAPFFDDLVPIAGTSSIDVYRKGNNPTVVQWTDFATSVDPAARLTFRVVLEVNAANNRGSVGFQYIKMTGGGGNGVSATIGIQRTFDANQYAFNTAGATLTGTAAAGQALQSVLFGFDTDGDRLNDALEAVIGTNPANHDTDNGGLDDGAELAAGKDPTAMGDDGASTDTDSDGLSNADEAFYGTDPTKKDTDGDSIMGTTLDDNDEVYTQHTNPLLADTDGDGTNDAQEIANGTDPLDPTDGRIDLNALNDAQSEPHAALDANNNLHIVSVANNGTALFYYMTDAAGTVKIPQTAIKLPPGVTPGAVGLRYPQIAISGGKVFLKLEIISNSGNNPNTSGARNAIHVGLIRLNPANAPQDGSAVLGAQLVEKSVLFAAPGATARHVDMAVDATGIHLAYMLLPGVNRGNYGFNMGYAYSQLSADGVLIRTLTFPLPTKTSPGGGTHRWARPYVRITADGTINLVTEVNLKKVSGGFLWTTIKGTTTKTYDVPLTHSPEHLGVATKGNLLYVFTGGGQRRTTYQMMVLDPANFTSAPVAKDHWFAPQVIDAGSSLAFGPILQSGEQSNQAAILPLPNGTAIGHWTRKNEQDICLQGLLPDGRPSAPPICMLPGENRRIAGSRTRGIDAFTLLALPNGYVGFVHNYTNTNSLFFDKVPLSRFNFPATLPTVNTPPKITSTPPPGVLRVGKAYSYPAMATDAETPANQLVWSLDTAPTGMTVSATGAVTWTPVEANIGDFQASLRACDNGTPQRCATQVLSGSVVANSAPIITSQPPMNASVDQAYAYQLAVDDPDMDVNAYELTAPSPAPGNMALSATGLLTWTPTDKDLGSTVVTLTVKDAAGHATSQTFTILVTLALDIDPRFTTTASSIAVVGQAYSYTAVAVDPGDSSATMTYTLESTPSGNMTISPQGVLSWTPTDKERGTQAITIKASSSSGRSATQSFSVTVTQLNGGCGCTLGGATDDTLRAPWLIIIAGLAFALWRRRRAA